MENNAKSGNSFGWLLSARNNCMCVFVCLCVCVCLYVCVYVCICVCVWKRPKHVSLDLVLTVHFLTELWIWKYEMCVERIWERSVIWQTRHRNNSLWSTSCSHIRTSAPSPLPPPQCFSFLSTEVKWIWNAQNLEEKLLPPCYSAKKMEIWAQVTQACNSTLLCVLQLFLEFLVRPTFCTWC